MVWVCEDGSHFWILDLRGSVKAQGWEALGVGLSGKPREGQWLDH